MRFIFEVHFSEAANLPHRERLGSGTPMVPVAAAVKALAVGTRIKSSDLTMTLIEIEKKDDSAEIYPENLIGATVKRAMSKGQIFDSEKDVELPPD